MPISMRLCLAVSLVLVAGCRTGDDLSKVNNRLREQNLALREEVMSLRMQLDEREVVIKEMTAEPGELPADIAANLPRIVKIELGRLTTLADVDGQTVLRAYIEPLDGRSRFTQMTGRVTLQVVVTPEDADAETIASQRFGPGEVREAYRSSFMGTHYTFELPLDSSLVPAGASLLVVAHYEDGATGLKLAAERAIEVPE